MKSESRAISSQVNCPKIVVLVFLCLSLSGSIAEGRKKKARRWPPRSVDKCVSFRLGWAKKSTVLLIYRKCFKARYHNRKGSFGARSPSGFSLVSEDVVTRNSGGKGDRYLCRTKKKRRSPLYKRERCKKKLKRMGLDFNSIPETGQVRKWKPPTIYSGLPVQKILRKKPLFHRQNNGYKSLELFYKKTMMPKELPNKNIARIEVTSMLAGSGRTGVSVYDKVYLSGVFFNRGFKAMGVRITFSRRTSSGGTYWFLQRWVVLPLRLTQKSRQHLVAQLKRLKNKRINAHSTSAPVPRQPLSAVRCRRNSDCVIHPRSPCQCPQCGEPRHTAINKDELRRIRNRWARMRCRMPRCPRCKPYVAKYRYRAKCVRKRCRVRRYRSKKRQIKAIKK